MNKKTIRIIACCVIACMFVVVPTSLVHGDSKFGFAYHFIWDVGFDETSVFPSAVDPLYLVAQIIGVLAITWLLTKDSK
ncbi:hypothetical protein VN981_19125 [Klebsiella pneumoniae]|uniref:hypothetical protein n=1 Tax=Klebsiella pneumoniae TaxID=573 RepID=UPI002D7A366D|nr:hypothetical protein [Klebsiella pneumoniae]WRT87205.1 hypothetical protein VN981_19125 [Klebsiella pneumoniae]